MEFNEKVIFVTTVLGVFLIMLGILFVLTDFYNDYKCSTTTDPSYWLKHNCIKYCKECKSDYNK